MAAVCRVCNDPLELTIDPEDSGDEGQTVPDDLELRCGCHYHWQCLLDHASEVITSLKCPACGTYLPVNASGPSTTDPFVSAAQAGPISTRYTNEGGVQEDLDILPALTEEAFLAAYPEARPARAMHTMVGEGDVGGIVSLLADIDADEDVDITAPQLLRWTDPLNGGRSPLHVAIEAGQEEVFWLLLWLGSGIKRDAFPQAVIQSADELGLPRREVTLNEDIRFITDESGRLPVQIMADRGAPWSRYVEGGLFN